MQPKKIPIRRCVGCGEGKPKKELVRVVRSAAGEVNLDLTGRMPGRGAYLCRDTECLRKARKARRLEKEFSQAIPDEVYDRLEKELGGADHEQ
ncbi:MAG: YlxR family protein [Bacteroidales bacterium]|nr:YlxR family protein [Fournierella massiliensis]MCF2556046.1 YlxR family protein [Fournierella massiliensis]MCI6739243.1 YlxR family protein [Bacteroidales bacterium]